MNDGLPPAPNDIDRLFRCRAGLCSIEEVHPALRSWIELPADELAAEHECAQVGRRASGTYYTPHALADALVEAGFAALGEVPEFVVDLTCGAGSVLGVVAARMLERGVQGRDVARSIGGVDIDPVAVAIARGCVLERTGCAESPPTSIGVEWLVADALAEGVRPVRRPDLIVGNPPFGNAIGRQTRRVGAQRVDFARRFPHAARGAYDRASLFLERALQWVRPGGVVALVLPRALLAASYADALREWIERAHELDSIVVSDDADHFEGADVLVVGAVIRAGDPGGVPSLVGLSSAATTAETCAHRALEVAARRVRCIHLDGRVTPHRLPPGAAWAALVSEHAGCIDSIGSDWPRLDAIVSLQAGASTGEAYELRPYVTDAQPESGWKFVTTGLIDPERCLWGERRCRYLGGDFRAPWLPRDAVNARRAALYDRPKVLVAGLSRVLEAVVDAHGEFAGAVATLAITVAGDRLDALGDLCAWLNSPSARAQYAARFGAQGLSGGSVPVTKRNLGALRVPPAVAMAVCGER